MKILIAEDEMSASFSSNTKLQSNDYVVGIVGSSSTYY